MKERFKNYIKRIKDKVQDKLANSSVVKDEPPKTVISVISKMSFYSFILFATALVLFIIKIVQMIFKFDSFIYFGFIYVILIIGFAFYVLRRMYIKAYNEDKMEIVEGLVLNKKTNKLTRQKWITFQTNSGVERELEITKKTKLKKGGIYEFCIMKPTESKREMLLAAEFIKYKEENIENLDEELIQEE